MLLLDEPLSALDAKVRRQLREEIRRIQIAVGTTTLFVTHDQEEALALGDRVGVMSAGRLEQIAPPAELYDRPRTAFVAEFVGLTNRIRGVARDGAVDLIGQRVPLLEGSAGRGPGDRARPTGGDPPRPRHDRIRQGACGELPRLGLPGPGGAPDRRARRASRRTSRRPAG